jgi:NAD(P)-dependent dehydrogenase (short-subunit alcohol dehydrogenase family)
MNLKNSVALVTGANHGIGEEFTRQLRRRGAAKVYAAARDISTITAPGVEPLELDITNVDQARAAASVATDVDLLINSAGIATLQAVVTGDLRFIRHDLEVNVFGPLLVTRAFSETLRRTGGGAVIDVLSAASWYAVPGNAAYSVSNAAAWNLTNAFRVELAGQGTQVLGAHGGLVDTEIGAGWDSARITTSQFVSSTLDALEAGATEALADDLARRAKQALAGPPQAVTL